MSFRPLRLLLPALICLGGGPAGAQAMGDTPWSRSGVQVRAREDALAWSLLGTVGLTFGLVTACGWGIRRHQRRSGPEAEYLDDLRRELNRPPLPPESGPVSPPPKLPETLKNRNRPAWEKPPDWWRQDFSGD